MVARLTGLNPHVIRIWEKRYGAVTPSRTESNRRLYSDEEVERLRLLARATEGGHKISIIARLGLEDLRRLVAAIGVEGQRRGLGSTGGGASGVEGAADGREAGAGQGFRPANGSGGDRDEWDGADLVAEAVRATQAFRSEDLIGVLERGAVRFGHQGLLHRLIHPLARELGELWLRGGITAAHEHFASALMREFLLNGARPVGLGEGVPRLVVGTPAGQLHELGAVMAAAAATHLGWRAVYLGASLPAAEIAGAAIQNRARLVLLSVVYPSDDPHLPSELRQLRRYLPREIEIVVGGRSAPMYGPVLAEIQARLPEGLPALCDLLEELRGVRSE